MAKKRAKRHSYQKPTRLLVIDGYNCIIAKYGARSLDHRMDELHRKLLQYMQRHKREVWVVYDGEDGIVPVPDPRLKPLHIVHTPGAVTADQWIVHHVEDRCERGLSPSEVTVVTTDIKDIWRGLEHLGLELKPSLQFWEELEKAQPRLKAGQQDPIGAQIIVTKKELEETAKFLEVHPDEEVKLATERFQALPKKARKAKPKPPEDTPKTPDRPPNAARLKGAKGDRPGDEKLPSLMDRDAWEEMFSKAKPAPAPPGQKRPDKKKPLKNRKKGEKDLPGLADLDAWEKLFGEE